MLIRHTCEPDCSDFTIHEATLRDLAARHRLTTNVNISPRLTALPDGRYARRLIIRSRVSNRGSVFKFLTYLGLIERWAEISWRYLYAYGMENCLSRFQTNNVSALLVGVLQQKTFSYCLIFTYIMYIYTSVLLKYVTKRICLIVYK